MQYPCNAFGLLSKKQYAPNAEIRFMIKLLTLPSILPTLHPAFTKMKMRNIASYQRNITFCIRRNTLAHELLSAAVGEKYQLILRMLMQGQHELRISHMAAQSCHFVRNLSF